MVEIKLITLDMAGTTLRDQGEVEACFERSLQDTGLDVSAEWIKSVQGLSKLYVFELLWREHLGADHPEYQDRVNASYANFRQILEHYYQEHEVYPTDGCLETLAWARENGIHTSLTTGFYREVADLILDKLGWLEGLDENRVTRSADSVISQSITSDEVEAGRPAPFMIQKAMATFGVTNPQAVVNIGDTPSDLESGKRAGVRWSLGLTNGTHSRAQLENNPHDGLLDHLGALPAFIQTHTAP